MSDDAFDLFQDPSKETKLGWQREKETLGGSASKGPCPWKEGDRLGDFRLESLLGRGSSGYVFRALDVKTHRRCALKLLSDAAPDDLLRNKLGFRRMMSIEHPNLLKVDRIYQLGSSVALSMEEIDGSTLTHAVHRFKALEPQDAYYRLLGLLRDYASGLAMMHANGYIHRDIKPDNLMVDHRGRGRVIDYGLVDAFELEDSAYGARGFLLGTPHYFAPEVIWSQRYLPAGDIFSLGLVMLDALRVIQSSSKGRREAQLKRAERQQDDAERIDEAIEGLSESVPTTILEACREMLERYPADRPTAMELSRLGCPRVLTNIWPHEEPLVGRAAERREIVAWVESIFCGNAGRLHLTGPSGIGKSHLIEQVVKTHIEEKKWGQVFSASCRVREDQPLQAFDQICDAITHRYMQGDRERLELDPVSVGILEKIFPVLKNVFTANLRLLPPGGQVEPIDAIEAAVRMTEQLRLVGPLFLVVDNAQWADRDSLNVLDRLQTAVGGEGLGIITISRDSEDRQRLPATKYVQLGPLGLQDSVAILARSADRYGLEVSRETLYDLAEASAGSPFRLRELADEFRPGGAFSENSEVEDPTSAFALPRQIDELWKRRAERLSREAKQVLTYVVTSGSQVSTQQLGKLTGLDDAVDAAVSELTRQRLITDEATGGECIAIFHDHFAEELVGTLDKDSIAKAHHDWALLLSRSENHKSLAARIASHFIDAGEPGRAVGHAILAAEDAERRSAISEAARWYARVIDHLDGPEKIRAIRNAARCYRKADFPLAAADRYTQLSELVDAEERAECLLLAVTLLVRSGHFARARNQLLEFAASMGLPKPKTAWQSKLALITGEAMATIRGRHALWRSVVQSQREVSETAAGNTVDEPDSCVSSVRNLSTSVAQKLRSIRFCSLVIRPLILCNNLYAGELNLAANRLLRRFGSRAEKTRFAMAECVFDCYDKGRRRIEGETNLLALKPHVEQLGCEFTTAEFWTCMAFSHALSCRWDQVSQPVDKSMEYYQQVGAFHGFEVAHTKWIDLWAKWNLGRWEKMSTIVDEMLHDARRRNDLLRQRLTCSGFGGAAFLLRDRTDELQRLIEANQAVGCDSDQVQVLDALDWIASIQFLLYQGDYAGAWERFESLDGELRRLPFARIQLFRVSRAMLGALTAIHNLAGDFQDIWRVRAAARILQLRQEPLPYAEMLASLYDGLLHHRVAIQGQSESARSIAREQLTKARQQAMTSHLRPFQLAAEDLLSEIERGQSWGALMRRMSKRGVVRPEAFSRLYTVVDE